MKRLTEFTIPEMGFSVVSEEKYKRILMNEKPSVEKVYNRLKKIEDILGDEYDLDHLRELVQVDREGRCVVLPAKIGSEIYVMHTCKSGRRFCSTHEIAGMHLCDKIGYRGVRRKEYLVLRRDGFSNHLDIDKIGKTAFLTRWEAENALGRRET